MKILLVDDDDDIRMVAKFSLERVGGHAVTPAASGLEAIAIAGSTDLDLIVMDMMMPGMDGLSAMQAIRALPAGGDAPVIFLTAKVQGSEVQVYLDAGALGVITKPFDPMTLPAEVARIYEASRPG